MWKVVAVIVVFVVVSGVLFVLVNYNQMAMQISVRPYEVPQLQPPAGTVAADIPDTEIPEEELSTIEEAADLQNKVPADERSVLLGQKAYKSYCLPCHGANLDGYGPVGPSLPGTMKPLDSPDVAQRTDGELYWIIGNRLNAHPPIGRSMTEDERWNTVNFLRSAQRKASEEK